MHVGLVAEGVGVGVCIGDGELDGDAIGSVPDTIHFHVQVIDLKGLRGVHA